MDVNTYLKIDIYFAKHFLAVEIDKKVILTEILFLKKKDKRHQKKNLTVNLLELILVEKIMMQAMKLVEYRRLLVILIKKKKRTRRRNKKNQDFI